MIISRISGESEAIAARTVSEFSSDAASTPCRFSARSSEMIASSSGSIYTTALRILPRMDLRYSFFSTFRA